MHSTSRISRILLTTFVLGTILLSSCQNTGTGTDPKPTPSPLPKKQTSATPLLKLSPTPSPTAEITSDIQSLSGLKIVFSHPWTGATQYEIAKITNEFNDENIWGIQVLLDNSGGPEAFFDNLYDPLQNKSPVPNIVAIPSDMLASLNDQYPDTFINLSSFINDPEWGLTEQEIADLPPLLWKESYIDEKQLGIPAQASLHVLFYNNQWAEELGFNEPPASISDLEKQACAAANKNLLDPQPEFSGTGGWITNYNVNTVISWFKSFKYSSFERFEKEKYELNTEEGQQTFAFLRRMYDAGCAWNSRESKPYDYFAKRQALLYSGTTDDIVVQARAMRTWRNNDRWSIIQYPAGEEKPFVFITTKSYAITSATPSEELASWLFMRWLTLPRHYAQITEATGSYPLNHSSLEVLDDFIKNTPQLQPTLSWLPLFVSAPKGASWLMISPVIEDAVWQLYQPETKPYQVPIFLIYLDASIREIMGR